MRDLPSHTLQELKRLSDSYDWSEGGEEWTRDVKKYKGLDPEQWKVSLVNHMMLKYIKEGSTVLEIGSGAGRWSEYLQRVAKRFLIADISEKCLTLCRKRFEDRQHIEYHLIKGRLDFVGSGEVDHIWAYDVFVHINPADIERYLEDFSRVLKRGGVAVIHHVGHPTAEKDIEESFRSHMTCERFAGLVTQYGMTLIEQDESLAHRPGDVISVFKKPPDGPTTASAGQ